MTGGMLMKITETTKLAELMKEYPWLVEEAVKLDERLKVLKNPLMKAVIKKASVKDLAEKAEFTPEAVIEKIENMIAEHQK